MSSLAISHSLSNASLSFLGSLLSLLCVTCNLSLSLSLSLVSARSLSLSFSNPPSVIVPAPLLHHDAVLHLKCCLVPPARLLLQPQRRPNVSRSCVSFSSLISFFFFFSFQLIALSPVARKYTLFFWITFWWLLLLVLRCKVSWTSCRASQNDWRYCMDWRSLNCRGTILFSSTFPRWLFSFLPFRPARL